MKLPKFVEIMVAVQEGEDEGYARAAVNPITCQDMLETQSKLRRLSFKTMLLYYAVFFIMALLELINQFVSKGKAPGMTLVMFAFMAMSGTASFMHYDMKVKLLKTLRAQQMQAQVLTDGNRF